MKTRFRILGKLRRLLQKLQERDVLMLLSLVVGICCGLAAVVLKLAVEYVHHGVTALSEGKNYNFLFLVLPGIGMLLSLLFVRYIVKDNIGHGVTKVLVAVSKNESKIKPHNMWTSVLASSVTIGFGGSVGAEAPIVYTGAAIGSNVARAMGLSYKNMTILLGCGAAGAVAGIFKAPLAGVLFTLEILLFNISMTSILPLLLSTISATVVSYIFLGDSLPFECSLSPFAMGNIPFYLVLGVFCAGCSVYFTRMTLWLEDKIKEIKKQFNASEHGGAPILGISRPVIKAHGSSDANAIKNAVRQAIFFVETKINDDIVSFAADYDEKKILADADKIYSSSDD